MEYAKHLERKGATHQCFPTESLLLATRKLNNPYTKRKFIETIYLRKIKQIIIVNFQSHSFFLSKVR